MGQFADKHKMPIGYHGHATTSAADFETVLSYAKYNAVNLDLGHFTAGQNQSPVPFIKKNYARITHVHVKDRKLNNGPNVPFGQGDTPIKETLQLMRDNKWPFQAIVEFEYPVPADSDLNTELDMIAVNVSAVMALAHLFARRLVARGRGGLVLFSSIVGWQGTPLQANYAATKAYVQVFAEGLHAELSDDGVHVLAVAPGPVRSGFAVRAGMTMGAAAEPEGVARQALAALGRRATLIPGVGTKTRTYALWSLPRSARSRIMRSVINGMRNEPEPTR